MHFLHKIETDKRNWKKIRISQLENEPTTYFRALSYKIVLNKHDHATLFICLNGLSNPQMFKYQIVLLTRNRDTFNKLKSKNRFEIGHLEQKLWSFFKALSFEFALALFTARHFYLEFCRSPKSRMFIYQIVLLTCNSDTFDKLK